MADHKALTPADAANAIIAEMSSSFDVSALVAQARAQLGVAPVGIEPGVVDVTGETAILINEMLARASEAERIAKAATAERETIKSTLRDLLGAEHEVLRVNNAEVFTNKASISRVLDQAAVKAAFPDIPGNERFWKTQESKRALFK